VLPTIPLTFRANIYKVDRKTHRKRIAGAIILHIHPFSITRSSVYHHPISVKNDQNRYKTPSKLLQKTEPENSGEQILHRRRLLRKTHHRQCHKYHKSSQMPNQKHKIPKKKSEEN